MVRVDRDQGSVLTEWRQLFSSEADFLINKAFSNSFWRIAVLAAAGLIGTVSYAPATASIYWPDYDAGISGPPPFRPQRPHKVRRHQGPKNQSVARESTKPQGPLIIAISIERQSLKIFDANGFFAETPISTGMRGHPTPMGVFSVIQKQKFHRSNIYSGAPMPYMQRITWSGVAMHAGVLPGYPASHGCIRMPMNFAVKMWGWTRMGARVVVTPGEMTPSSFSHPLLTAQHPASAPTPVASATTKSDKAVVAVAAIAPATSEAAAAIKREQAQTADASGTMPAPTTPATMSDATPSIGGPASTDNTGKPEAAAGALNFAVVSPSEDRLAEVKPAETLTALVLDAGANAPDRPDSKTADKTRETNVEPTEVNPAIADLRKDQARPSDADKAAAAKADLVAPKHSGQIAVFISRKDGKLYVRQNFAPLFEVPVTIAASDRPLGTHVFTAQADKDDPKSFHWSVVTLPMTRYAAERRDNDERVSRRRRTVGAVEMKSPPVPDSPAEALDRITIPADTMAKITDALSTGASIIVSDQGIMAGETGEGTDFIVSLR
jgi:lipoprotein-anchoring transpeptidase ErfK/SrfK